MLNLWYHVANDIFSIGAKMIMTNYVCEPLRQSVFSDMIWKIIYLEWKIEWIELLARSYSIEHMFITCKILGFCYFCIRSIRGYSLPSNLNTFVSSKSDYKVHDRGHVSHAYSEDLWVRNWNFLWYCWSQFCMSELNSSNCQQFHVRDERNNSFSLWPIEMYRWRKVVLFTVSDYTFNGKCLP